MKQFALQGLENLAEKKNGKSAVDETLDLFETDRLKELTLLQTFDVRRTFHFGLIFIFSKIVETELENVYDYDGFNDCLEKFPL